jgi:uncharacterized protein YndB with AHSA1/START domain
MEPLEIAFIVGCSPDHAFAVWATRTSLWWPHGHSVSGSPGLTVTFEPRPGGRIYERTPEGEEHDWGEVLAWEPPHRLAYLWHLRFDRTDATDRGRDHVRPAPRRRRRHRRHDRPPRLGAPRREGSRAPRAQLARLERPGRPLSRGVRVLTGRPGGAATV